MLIKQVIEVFDLLDTVYTSGEKVQSYLNGIGTADIQVKPIQDGPYSTDFIKIVIPGKHGKRSGRRAPTLGIVGRLGALCGDVIICTRICPNAPTQPHEPVPFTEFPRYYVSHPDAWTELLNCLNF